VTIADRWSPIIAVPRRLVESVIDKSGEAETIGAVFGQIPADEEAGIALPVLCYRRDGLTVFFFVVHEPPKNKFRI
jgi:hypothetical protein